MIKRKLGLALLAAGFAAAAAAQSGRDNLSTLKQMKVATTDLNIPVVPQEGRNADAIRANLKNIKMPPGFKIELYAVVPDARHMAVAPSTNMLFVGTRKTRVWAVTDRNGDGAADEVKAFAPSLNFKVPNGVCWTKDGFLIVVEHNRVLNFPASGKLSTRPAPSGPGPRKTSARKSTRASTRASATTTKPRWPGATTAWKAAPNTPSCSTCRPRPRSTCGTATRRPV